MSIIYIAGDLFHYSKKLSPDCIKLATNFINSLSNSNYSGCFGLKLSKRPQSNNDTPESKNKKIIEPMWVWKKGDDRSLDEIIDSGFPLSKFFS